MTISYPLDLLNDFPGWSTSFELLYRQEYSRHASGRTRVKDFGTPIWQATYVTKNLSPNKVDYWKARLHTLEGGLKTFKAYPKSRCWPINHPGGEIFTVSNWVLESGFWEDSGVWYDYILWSGNTLPSVGLANSVNANGKALSVKGVPYLDLTIGDFLEIEGTLYQVVEDAGAAGEDGVTPEFEVRPHLDSAIVADDVVNLHRPSVDMTLVPGSVSMSTGLNGRGSISFQAIEARG